MIAVSIKKNDGRRPAGYSVKKGTGRLNGSSLLTENVIF